MYPYKGIIKKAEEHTKTNTYIPKAYIDPNERWLCPECGMKFPTSDEGMKHQCKYEKDPGKTWTAVDEPEEGFEAIKDFKERKYLGAKIPEPKPCEEQPDYDFPMTTNYQIHMERIAEERKEETEKHFPHLTEALRVHDLIVEKVITNPDGSVSIVMREKDENMSSSEKFLHRFDRRNRELRQLLKDKGKDYSGEEDRHRNFKLVHFITCGKPLVITPLVSCLIRQLDKIQRAFNLLLNGQAYVKGETMKDTLKDNTGYANIAEDVWEVEEGDS